MLKRGAQGEEDIGNSQEPLWIILLIVIVNFILIAMVIQTYDFYFYGHVHGKYILVLYSCYSESFSNNYTLPTSILLTMTSYHLNTVYRLNTYFGSSSTRHPENPYFTHTWS